MRLRRIVVAVELGLATVAVAAPASAEPTVVVRVDSAVTVTPDLTGRATIPYCPVATPCAFSQTPGSVLVTGRQPASGTAIPVHLVAYNPTATGFTLRALNQSGTAIMTPIEVWYHASIVPFDQAEGSARQRSRPTPRETRLSRTGAVVAVCRSPLWCRV